MANRLPALLISPNRKLAEEFCQVLPEAGGFDLVADLKAYPAPDALARRLVECDPEAVFLDLFTDLEQACGLIRRLLEARPRVPVVGLHRSNDSDAVVRSLRLGAREFLYAPFDVPVQREALERLSRLLQAAAPAEHNRGKAVALASVKPGSGASTLAAQLGFALGRRSKQRVLLADCDLTGGTIGFYLKLNNARSLREGLERAGRLEASWWTAAVGHCHGVDVLAAPERPSTEPVEPSQFHELLESARGVYDWVILDTPVIFSRSSLLAMAESDHGFLVSTPELPSLHLARKATQLLAQLGIGKERYRMLVNRVVHQDGLRASDMEKIFNCAVHATFPNDYFSLDRAVTRGQPLEPDCPLGKAIEEFSVWLAGVAGNGRGNPVVMEARAVCSEA